MLDAVEAILKSEGYDKLTARRVAQEAGFNHMTVYYYFKDMEDLIVATFCRRVTLSLARQQEAARSPNPLRAIFYALQDIPDAKISSEFAILASRMEILKIEVVKYLGKSRDLHKKIVSDAIIKKGNIDALFQKPAAAALLISSLMQSMAQEKALGFLQGHEEMRRAIEEVLDVIEPI